MSEERNSDSVTASRLDQIDEWNDEAKIICPFCGEDNYDRIGLKAHLNGGLFDDGCFEYNQTKVI